MAKRRGHTAAEDQSRKGHNRRPQALSMDAEPEGTRAPERQKRSHTPRKKDERGLRSCAQHIVGQLWWQVDTRKDALTNRAGAGPRRYTGDRTPTTSPYGDPPATRSATARISRRLRVRLTAAATAPSSLANLHGPRGRRGHGARAPPSRKGLSGS